MTAMTTGRRRSVLAVTMAAAMLGSAAPSLHARQAVTLPARDRMLGDTPQPAYSVGRAEGRDWEMFSGIRGMAFDAADNLYVLDGQNHRVVVFNAQGSFVRQFGRRGGGPGELQAPLHLTIAADGNVVVSDIGNRAFIVYSPAGEHVRNVPYASELGLPTSGMHADPRGGLIVRTMPPPQTGGTAPAEAVLYRQPLADARPAAVLRLATPAQTVTTDAPVGGQNARFVVRRDPVFAPRISTGVLPDGSIAYTHDEGYTVRIADPAGRQTATITRDIRPRRVTRQDQDAWRERQRDGGGTTIVMTGATAGSGVTINGAPAGGRAAAAAGSQVQLPEPEFAERMAVISAIRTDARGRIWVQRRNTDGADRGPIDLMDARGRYIGTLPPQALPAAVSASGLAAWNVTDDLGIERVEVRRLPRSWQ